MSGLDVPDYVHALQRYGERLGQVAASADLSASVPSCPTWTMRDLLRHVGYVHRWATGYVEGAVTEMLPRQSEAEQLSSGPDDAGLVAWYRDGLESLLHAVTDADPDLKCWTFMDAPTPLLFWARRQAHETSIHRADAELAAGAEVTAVDADFAIDGIDEVFMGFGARRLTRLRADPARSISIEPEDSDRRWRIHIAPGGAEIVAGDGTADGAVRGSASDLYLLLWNRRTSDGLDVSGESSALSLWRDTVKVRWV